MSDSPDFQPLMDAIFREKVLRARAEPVEEKFLGGLRLFDEAVVGMRGGIRAQFPERSEQEIEAELRRRIARIRQVQEYGFYTTTSPHSP